MTEPDLRRLLPTLCLARYNVEAARVATLVMPPGCIRVKFAGMSEYIDLMRYPDEWPGVISAKVITPNMDVYVFGSE